MPAAQHNLLQEIVSSGWGGLADTAARMVFIEATYIGLFVLPIAASAVLGSWRSLVSRSWRPWVVGTLWAAVVVSGLVVFTRRGLYMPYAEQFVSSWGLGPSDLHGGRPRIVGETFQQGLTVATAAASVIFGYFLVHRFLGRTTSSTSPPGRGVEGLVLTVLAWQAAGAILPSLHYRIPGPAAVLAVSLDRYLLPLLPLAVCLGIWALDEWRGSVSWPAWAMTAALAFVAVAGTRDYLVFQDRVHTLASELDRSGIPNGRLPPELSGAASSSTPTVQTYPRPTRIGPGGSISSLLTSIPSTSSPPSHWPATT